MSIISLSSSFSSLSFSSQISNKPKTLSFPKPNSFSLSHVTRTPPLVVLATVAAPQELETVNLKKYVKTRLPGGFAAQTIIGTGRRKCAIARVVLQEGTGKVIINYRDAKVTHPLFSTFCVVCNFTLIYGFCSFLCQFIFRCNLSHFYSIMSTT